MEIYGHNRSVYVNPTDGIKVVDSEQAQIQNHKRHAFDSCRQKTAGHLQKPGSQKLAEGKKHDSMRAKNGQFKTYNGLNGD